MCLVKSGLCRRVRLGRVRVGAIGCCASQRDAAQAWSARHIRPGCLLDKAAASSVPEGNSYPERNSYDTSFPGETSVTAVVFGTNAARNQHTNATAAAAWK